MRIHLLILLLVLFFLDASVSIGAQPTWGQCSCPAVKDPDAPSRYSTISNASLCVNTVGTEPEPLCAIVVHCLDDGQTGPNCGDHPRNRGWPGPNEAISLLPELTRQHYALLGEDPPFDADQIVIILKENYSVWKECWDRFRQFALREISTAVVDVSEAKDVTCTNTPSGWIQFIIPAEALDLTRDTDFGALSFQMAPIK